MTQGKWQIRPLSTGMGLGSLTTVAHDRASDRSATNSAANFSAAADGQYRRRIHLRFWNLLKLKIFQHVGKLNRHTHRTALPRAFVSSLR